MDFHRAYVLIKTSPNRTRDVCHRIRELAEVKMADVISGPYDIIAVVETMSADELLDLVMGRIRYADGVRDTLTCFAVRLTE